MRDGCCDQLDLARDRHDHGAHGPDSRINNPNDGLAAITVGRR